MIDQQKAKQLETITKWNGKVNACIYCGSVPEIFYVATGHDHTDFDIQWCPCRGSSKTEGELQREQIKQLEAERDRLRAALVKAKIQLERWEVKIDGEWGSYRSLKELERDGALSRATLAARKALKDKVK